MKTDAKPDIKIEYRPDGDMMYIALNDGASAVSEEIAPGIVVDFCEHGVVLGIEIEDAGALIVLLSAMISRMRESRTRILRLTIQNLREMVNKILNEAEYGTELNETP
jgi:uncharacterized protein YuzE